MRKFFSVMVHEYTQHVFRWRFLVSLLSLPGLMVVALFVVYLVAPRPQPSRPIGILDQSGFFTPTLIDQSLSAGLKLRQYDSQSTASQAMSAGEIEAYYYFPPGYPNSGHALRVANEPVNSSDQAALIKLIQARILEGQPTAIATRLTQGNHYLKRTAAGTNQSDQSEIQDYFLPILAMFVFMLAIFSTSGYLMQAVTIEKENRTMELLITSVSHIKLLAGKLCGIVAIGVTQLIIWFGLIYFLISAGQNSFKWYEDLNISLLLFIVILITLSLAFIMIAAMMIAVGAMVTQATEGQQITGPFSLPFILPFLFIFQIMGHPNGSLAFWLSILPFTSPITLIIRLSVARIPAWQVIVCLVIQACFAVFLVWSAGRAFQAGMLQYGKRLSIKDILHSG